MRSDGSKIAQEEIGDEKRIFFALPAVARSLDYTVELQIFPAVL